MEEYTILIYQKSQYHNVILSKFYQIYPIKLKCGSLLICQADSENHMEMHMAKNIQDNLEEEQQNGKTCPYWILKLIVKLL